MAIWRALFAELQQSIVSNRTIMRRELCIARAKMIRFVKQRAAR